MSDQQMRDWLGSAVDQMQDAMRASSYHNAVGDAHVAPADIGSYVALHESVSELHAATYAQPLPTGVEKLLDERATTLARYQHSHADNGQWLAAFAQQHTAITEQLSNAHQAAMAGQAPAEFSLPAHQRAHQPVRDNHAQIDNHREIAQHIEPTGYQQLPERAAYSEHPDHELRAHQREHGGPTSPGHHHGLSR